MRAPRYRFPDEVRSTTRSIASRMVEDGIIARTPEQLELWIENNPEAKESLERGGYNSAFSSHDLFPLLEVFIVQAGGPARQVVDERPARSPTGWPVWGLLLILVLFVAVVVALVL